MSGAPCAAVGPVLIDGATVDTAKVQGLLEGVLTGSRIGFKRVQVFRSGGVLLTFYSLAAAREAVTLCAPFLTGVTMGEGYDEGPVKPNGRRDASPVWRVVARIGITN